MSKPMAQGLLEKTQQADFLRVLGKAFEDSNTEFARAYYLFATAKLSDTYNSQEIYERYPQLTDEKTFHQIKALYDESLKTDFDHSEITRLFTSVLEFYIGNQLSEKADALENAKNQLKIDVSGLGIKPEGSAEELKELLYEDVSEWMKKLESKATRQELYNRMSTAFLKNITPLFIELFHTENKLLADLGYPDIVSFYSQTSRHELLKLAERGREFVEKTKDSYRERMSAYYTQRTGFGFSEATRADIAYVLNGKSPDMTEIDAHFPESNLVPLATKTFDGLGLNYSTVAKIVDFKTLDEYNKIVVNRSETNLKGTNGTPEGAVLLDISSREGKRSRAFVYPSKVGSEIYLSVKPEGGMDDYSAFFHESGPAMHFAYEDPELSFPMAMMGNNTVTEVYAYTFQNLFLNRHWLQHQAGLTAEQAKQAVSRSALNDLYMLRRYSSKMQFEPLLYAGDASQGISLEGKDKIYADLLTQGNGFLYDAEGWSRDVDAGFYVADYFTAWTLEAQLREYLCTHFGNPEVNGEDWYLNPEAGEFFKTLWKKGNLNQHDLVRELGSKDPNDIAPLLRLMNYNLTGETRSS